ncbi:uncharacterized protein LOC105161869 isoform X2 [Sesamum indicum]|uniref:Uncharacterized protein LOC105161869 isoform X2 n=1 Tax=Sesamum indicum TaxID=4182 RepID=A0A6I9T4S3_SESIN|nr:uncharacterized protein LOC105161869 isoform X2 [Sesamum indicum]
MGSRIITYSGGAFSLSRRSCRIVSGLEQPAGGAAVRWQVLEQVDKELSNGNERAALNLVKDLQAKPGGLRCFGTARQIPQRLYTLDELRLNGIEAASLLSPVDTTLGSIERIIQAAALLGGIAAWNVFDLSPQQILFTSLGFLFLWTFDAVSFNGGISFLVLDTLAHSFSQKYHDRVVQKEGSLNVQAGTAFVDFEFLEEVNKGKVSATTLNKFSCIALAGVATEYLLFGTAEGGLADINTLDKLLKSLGFTQKKADAQVRWAVLNTVLILRRHEKARAVLADAMSEGRSVSSCVDAIEETIDVRDL